MFIKEEEISGHHSLRKRFLKDLDKKNSNMALQEKRVAVAKDIRKKIDEVKLFQL